MVKVTKIRRKRKINFNIKIEKAFLFRDFAHKLSLALISNANTILQTIDLSHNTIEDKGKY